MADLATHQFDYTGAEQTYTVPVDGWYKLEAWGAQGDTWGSGATCRGGYGGYSTGVAYLKKNSVLHIYIGGDGNQSDGDGYNGGGKGSSSYRGGGGATHIASITGLLSTLGSQRDKIFLVAAGGGGAEWDGGDGGDGGGIKGSDGHQGTIASSDPSPVPVATGATQTAGGTNSPFDSRSGSTTSNPGSFGLGGNFTGGDAGGCGGGGWYGGGASDYAGGGGGGSGYIGNVISACGIEKHMAGYNVQTSSDASTKTITTTNYSSTATADYAKTGNGYATVQLLMPDINKLYLSPDGTAKRPRNALILGDGTAHHINKLYLGNSNNEPKLVWVNYEGVNGIVDVAGFAIWNMADLYVGVNSTSGFSGNVTSVEVSADNSTWVNVPEDQSTGYQIMNSWVAIPSSVITSLIGTPSTIYVRVVDGSTRYTASVT